ncbi:MAG TPA: hypothetical protein PKD55_01065 [Bellilinea sp.]|nr:hypothetical protein [Bellilinea sp.]
MPYKVADGHDIIEANLNTINPQPRSTGIRATRRVFLADGSVQDDGRYIELHWGIIDNPSAYQSLLSQFGVQNATTNDVTVYVPDETFAWVRYNGTAVRPAQGSDVRRQDFFIRDVVVLVRDLEAAS